MKEPSFKRESDISKVFSVESCIRTTFGYTDWMAWGVRELQGLFGIPDHVAVFWKQDALGRRIQRTFAFEMKKSNWRQAIVQAYRYASFAEYSFVVMDHGYVHRALAGLEEFKSANIGLLSVRVDGEVFWHYRPRYKPPYSKHMRTLLKAALGMHVFKEYNLKPNKRLQWTL
ncbi:MAG: hypothetical protein AB1510_04145 [Bacillota bacterium]